MAKLPPVSFILVVHVPKDLQIPPRIFEKIWNDPNTIVRGLEEDDSRKKPEAKSRDTVPLSATLLPVTFGESAVPVAADWSV